MYGRLPEGHGGAVAVSTLARAMPTSDRRRAPSRAIPVLIAVALFSGSLAAGIQLAGLSDREPSTAPGLRAGALPAAMAGARAPDFRLADGRGGVIDTRELRGRPYAVTFLYTHCVDVCPVIADDLRDALRAAPGAKVVAVSVDPGGDSAAAVRRFAARHRLPASFRYAIGSQQDLAPVWRAYLASPQGRDPRESSHSVAVWLVDSTGRLRGLYPGVPVPPADVAHDLRALAGS
jgi:protein SCO1/2